MTVLSLHYFPAETLSNASHYLILGFLGVVSGKLRCFDKKVSRCFTASPFPRIRGNICRVNSILDKCLLMAVRNCDVDEFSISKDIVMIYAEMCSEGTHM
ncbi:hypothetical protein NPIL_655311, partial [Nephila pilipes]